MLYLQKCMKSQLIKNRWSPEHAGAIFFVSLVEVEEERFRLLHLLAGCHQVFKKSIVLKASANTINRDRSKQSEWKGDKFNVKLIVISCSMASDVFIPISKSY